jgi:hypothetical protein
VVGVKIVGNVTVFASPCFESLKLAPGLMLEIVQALQQAFSLWLAHVRVKVVEVSQFLSPEPCICVGGIVSLVMLDVYKNIVLLCQCDEILMVFK